MKVHDSRFLCYPCPWIRFLIGRLFSTKYVLTGHSLFLNLTSYSDRGSSHKEGTSLDRF